MSDIELDALVATLGETDWGPNVTDTMTRWDQARRKAATAITTLRARIAELESERAEWVEVERLRMGKPTPPTPPA